ncbi:MAG: Fe-S cluster assembly ATPase SufC, partial [Alphaproteobacteria bacterium]
MTQPLLSLSHLVGGFEDKIILKDFSLNIEKGSCHAIMGPNGTGKSTLSYLLAGRDGYELQSGDALFKGKDITDLQTEERAQQGLFLAFQYPVEIPGVSNNQFLRHAVNAKRKANGLEEYDAMQFVKLLRTKAKELGIKDEMLKRPVNTGFSGGEKKRNEALQMAMLEPDLAILDETDSGLDIDALKTVAESVNSMRNDDRGFLIITHY